MPLFNIHLFCFIFAIISVAENKRYDVEEEAQKLYGQNLGRVLARFRKSADYLKILTAKANDIGTEFMEVFGQIWEYYLLNLQIKILDTLGFAGPTTTEEPKSPGVFRSSKKKVARRQELTEVNPETQMKIDRIDTYQKLTSGFTVKERNEFKDLGFKYIGDAIHFTIEKMGVEGVGKEFKSTRMPNGGEPQGLRARTTTEHAKDHRVTKELKTEATTELNWNDDTRKIN